MRKIEWTCTWSGWIDENVGDEPPQSSDEC